MTAEQLLIGCMSVLLMFLTRISKVRGLAKPSLSSLCKTWGCESSAQTDRFDHNGFAKSFDMVPHRWLLHKVVLDGQASDSVPVLSGVPQGSVLGPILFLIFMNDLSDNIRSSVHLIADDCVLYRNIYSLLEFDPAR